MGNSKRSSGDLVQLELWKKRQARRGKKLGRKRSKDSGVTHSQRPRLASRIPVHITMKLAAGLPTLREHGAFMVLLSCFRASNAASGLRIIDFSVQGNHVHMICEAADEQVVSSAMQGLGVRIARRLNARVRKFARRFWQRSFPSLLRQKFESLLKRSAVLLFRPVLRLRRRIWKRPVLQDSTILF
jgi:REP element-mobilizing transposase RayT